MSLFENFPYSNLHNLNLDWVLAKVRDLIADYIQMHEDFNTFTQDTDQAIADLRTYIDNYFENLDLPEEVRDVINEMLESGSLAEIIAEINPAVSVDLIAEYSCSIQNYEYNPGGFTYIGNGNYILLTRTYENGSNDDVYICRYNNDEKIIKEKHKHKLYHANTACYNPNTGKIYIAPGFTKIDSHYVYLTDIYVINQAHLDVIEDRITLPNGIRATNVAYDRTTGHFYIVGVNDSSVEDSISNFGKVYEFTDETFTEYKIINLENNKYTRPILRSSYQGCTVQDGILYQQYDYALCAIGAWDLNDGKFINIYNVPYEMNKCKKFIEMEDITYDYDRGRFVFMSASISGRTHGAPICNIADISFGKAIPEHMLGKTYHRAGNGQPVDIRVFTEDTVDCRPVMETGIFRSIYDAEFYSQTLGYEKPHYIIRASLTSDTGIAHLSNFTLTKSFRIEPRSGDTLKIGNVSLRRVLSAEFISCNFNGKQEEGSSIWGDAGLPKSNIYIYFNCHAIFSGCVFNDLEDRDIKHGVTAYNGGRVTLMAGNRYRNADLATQEELVYAVSRAYINLQASNVSPEAVKNDIKLGSVDNVEINRYYQIYKGDLAVGTANQVSLPIIPPINGEAYISVGGSSNTPMGIGNLITSRDAYSRYVIVPKEDRTGFYIIRLRISLEYLRLEDVKVLWTETTSDHTAGTITEGPTILQNFTLNIKM